MTGVALELSWRGDPADLVAAFDRDDAHRAFIEYIEVARPAWHAEAACVDEPLDVFFPTRGASLARARAICATCPVRAQCLDEALEFDRSRYELPGVWGGTSPRQRRQLRKERAAQADVDEADVVPADHDERAQREVVA